MEALQNGQTTVEGSIEGQSAGAASHAMIEKILSEEPRWQGTSGHKNGHAVSSQMSPLSLLPSPARSCPKELAHNGLLLSPTEGTIWETPSPHLTSCHHSKDTCREDFPDTL